MAKLENGPFNAEEAKIFLKEIEKKNKNLRWNHGDKPSQRLPSW